VDRAFEPSRKRARNKARVITSRCVELLINSLEKRHVTRSHEFIPCSGKGGQSASFAQRNGRLREQRRRPTFFALCGVQREGDDTTRGSFEPHRGACRHISRRYLAGSRVRPNTRRRTSFLPVPAFCAHALVTVLFLSFSLLLFARRDFSTIPYKIEVTRLVIAAQHVVSHVSLSLSLSQIAIVNNDPR